MTYIIKCLSSYSNRTRIKSHLRRLKNIGMVSEQLYQSTLNVGRFVQLRCFPEFCGLCCYIRKPVLIPIPRLVIPDPSAVIPDLTQFVLLIRDTIYLVTTVLSTVCMDYYFLLKALPEHSTGWNQQWSSTPKLACYRLQHSNLQRLRKLMRKTRSPCNEYESRTLGMRLVSPGIYSNKWVNRFKTWFTFKKQVPTNHHQATVADKTDELKNIVNIIWASVFFVMTVRKRLFKPLTNGTSLFISWNQVCWLDFSLWASSPFGEVARIHERAARERRRECECFAARSRVFSRFASLAM